MDGRGAIMISDMFNNALKSPWTLFNRKVRARMGLCNVDHQTFW
jgi:hypothetical protein